VLLIGGTTFATALLVAMLLSRGLARPIVELSRQAREAVRGEPKPVEGRGGRELEELGAAFNQAIQDLGALRRRLAASERIAAQREIARRVAHEIKNPLAPIRAAVETLRRLRARGDPAFDEYFDEASRTVLEEVARISHIVTEFTRFARLPAPQPAPMDLGDAARKVVSLHTPSHAEVRLAVEPCPVTADRDQIVQVLTNLVQNALEACENTPQPVVEVRVAPAGPAAVCLVVRDNGPGVAPEMRDRLFLPYATTKEKGTGLGLSMVHHIVTEHDGEVTYRDAAGGGAEFVVTLPSAGPAPPPSNRGRTRPSQERQSGGSN
jgi:nitrogen fixation/metabolism regulation signal transduction histidine kinase